MVVKQKFRIIYLWQGERHVLLHQPDNEFDANREVIKLRAAGFHSWFEQIR